MLPYLFFLCSEGLAGLLKRAVMEKLIHGISLSRRGPHICHLFFADDFLLFCRATASECQNICELLKIYEDASGQQVNLVKSYFLQP